MFHHFRIIPFVAGIGAGILMLLYYKAPKSIIYEYPHPQNVKDRVYRDKNGVCYAYTSTTVDCDANETTLRPYPIQS